VSRGFRSIGSGFRSGVVKENSPELVPPPAQRGRPFDSGRAQSREEIGIVDRALSSLSIWELGVGEVVGYDTLSASRGLSEARVSEADLLEQERIATEYRCGTLRARVWRDRVGSVSDHENWILELCRCICRKPFDGPDRPFIRNVTKRPERSKRGGDLSSVAHDDAEYVLDCHAVIVEVVRSRDSCESVSSQILGGSNTNRAQDSLVDREAPGRDVIFGASGKRDVVVLGDLQDCSYELEDFVVHMVAP